MCEVAPKHDECVFLRHGAKNKKMIHAPKTKVWNTRAERFFQYTSGSIASRRMSKIFFRKSEDAAGLPIFRLSQPQLQPSPSIPSYCVCVHECGNCVIKYGIEGCVLLNGKARAVFCPTPRQDAASGRSFCASAKPVFSFSPFSFGEPNEHRLQKS